MNRLDKQTVLFKVTSTSSIFAAINNNLFAEHRPMTVFPENLLTSQILWTDGPKSGSGLIFPIKQAYLHQKPVAALLSARYQPIFPKRLLKHVNVTCSNFEPRNAFLIDGICQK